MTTEEAVKACEFWTTNLAETMAFGSTSDPEVGLHFNGTEHQREAYSNPGKLGWTITVGRWVKGKDIGQAENDAYRLVAAEIERRERS